MKKTHLDEVLLINKYEILIAESCMCVPLGNRRSFDFERAASYAIWLRGPSCSSPALASSTTPASGASSSSCFCAVRPPTSCRAAVPAAAVCKPALSRVALDAPASNAYTTIPRRSVAASCSAVQGSHPIASARTDIFGEGVSLELGSVTRARRDVPAERPGAVCLICV